MKFIIGIVLVYVYLKHVVTLDCYWNNECKYKYFSSKTPYENVRGDIRDSIIKQKGCEAISVWTTIRHGQRTPRARFVEPIKSFLNFKDDILSSYENGNSSLCAQDISNLRHWKIDRSFLNEREEVTSEGYNEILGISSRLREVLPELLNDLREEDGLFRPAFGPRIQATAEAFIEGLKNDKLLVEQAKENSSTANPYDSCKKYIKEVHDNPNIHYRILDYRTTADYLNMQERIERKLGLNFTLTYNNIIALYDLCRFTWKGIENKPSAWCAVFSDEDLKVLEYIGDLEHYARNGYGASHYSKTLGQIQLADLLTNLQLAKNNQGKKIVAYFSHSTLMDMMTVALDLYKDVNPLTGAYRDINRKWRTSFLSTFGVNIIAVLNRCKTSSENEYDHNVSFYRNEKPLLELCNAGVCSWQEFQDKFEPFLNATTDIC